MVFARFQAVRIFLEYEDVAIATKVAQKVVANKSHLWTVRELGEFR